MRESYDFIPNKIFDTMIASQILGIDKLGLANLVEKYFKVSLSKGPQKMDWSLRPLPDKMFDYSANDVKYLPKLKKILTKEFLLLLSTLKQIQIQTLLIHHQKINTMKCQSKQTKLFTTQNYTNTERLLMRTINTVLRPIQNLSLNQTKLDLLELQTL